MLRNEVIKVFEKYDNSEIIGRYSLSALETMYTTIFNRPVQSREKNKRAIVNEIRGYFEN